MSQTAGEAAIDPGIDPPVDPVIDVERLTVRYGKTTALDDVSLQVTPGSVYALLGRNGAGKSSLVRCLLGQQKPTSGRVRLLGRESWQHRVALMRDLGVVPEEPDAPLSMTPKQLGRFCSRLYPRWDAAGFAARLNRFEVPATTAFGQLSKGQKAQVMMALALAPQPRLLVLDDPTLGLDVVARRAVYEELIVELADWGMTVFITSHDLAGIEAVADRVAILSARKVALEEPLESLKKRFRRVTFGRIDGHGDRSSDGTDLLAALEPLEVRSRGRGIEALVSRFDDEAFERLRSNADVEGAEAMPASLEEIVIAVTEVGGEPGR